MAKKPVSPKPRATKLPGKPVPLGTPKPTKIKSNMPKIPGNIATGSKKTARPRPAGKPTKKPITQAQKEAAAMDALMKKRAKVSKKNDGMYPNYKTN
jgi:hypothetical protein